jgi:hypothetical protein
MNYRSGHSIWTSLLMLLAQIGSSSPGRYD